MCQQCVVVEIHMETKDPYKIQNFHVGDLKQ